MEIFFLAAFLGLVPATIAHGKGYSFAGYWFFGAALFIVALPVAILKENKNADSYQVKSGQRRPCPHCAEPILSNAKVCRYCGRDVPPPTHVPPDPSPIRIIRMLEDWGEASTEQVADRLDLGLKVAEESLWDMADRGLVKSKVIIGSHNRLWRLVN